MKWISVEDRLPEGAGHFIIHNSENLQIRIRIEWFTGFDFPQDVTHWMPLPEPPKEDK